MFKGLQANNDAGFKRFMGVHDLNFDFRICDAYGFKQPGCRMNVGKTLFAQVME